MGGNRPPFRQVERRADEQPDPLWLAERILRKARPAVLWFA